MAVVLQAQAPGLGPTEYDALQQEANWENNPAPGAIFHVAWFDDEGLKVVDVWETEAAWETFLNDRLMPAFNKFGVTERPPHTVTPAHRYFNAEAASQR